MRRAWLGPRGHDLVGWAFEDKTVVLVVEQDPAEVPGSWAQITREIGHGGVRDARGAVEAEQAHGAAVAVLALEPVDAGDALGDGHRVGFHQGSGLGAFALPRVSADLGEPDRHVRPGRVPCGQHFPDGWDYAHVLPLPSVRLNHTQGFIR